jgi:transcriptional regulator with XRE-family HTH domain
MRDLQIAVEARRREAGAFLRSRRERLSPSNVGLPEGFRRRTPGLRREEVALLAGVGTTWYTWLEQGRDVRPSPEVLSALSDALRLNAAERRHLFILNDRPPPEPKTPDPDHVGEPLQRMLASLTQQPAYVIGRRWDVLAWNSAAVALFGDYGKLEGDERNIMRLVFTNTNHRKLLVDWEELARMSLAMFRSDNARYAGDPDFERLIETLKRDSREFHDWWERHEVLQLPAGHKRLNHPQLGLMSFEHTSFAVTDRPDLKLVVYTAVEADGTIDKLSELLGKSAQV